MHMAQGGFAGSDKRFGTKIIGLPAITATRPYLVPVIKKEIGLDIDWAIIYSKEYNSGGDKTLVYCNAWEAVSL